MNYSEKKQRQIALSAFINGVGTTLDLYSINNDTLNQYIEKLISGEIPLFSSICEEIITCARSKGVKSTSETWGMSSQCLEKLLSSCSHIESTKTFTETGSMITPSQMKTWATVSIQPAGPNDEVSPKKKKKATEDKRKITNYSIDQKIQAVKEFVKSTNQSETARELNIPAVNLMRWREKIRKEAFQEAHVLNLYEAQKRGQKNKMFKDLDARVYEWFKANKEGADLDQALMSYAKELVRIDDSEPVVTQVWLNNFKKHFKIREQ